MDIISSFFTNSSKTLSDIGSNIVSFGSETYKDFGTYMFKTEVMELAIATVIGIYINNFIDDFFQVVGIPIIDKFIGNEKDIEKKYRYTLFGIEFEIGKIIEIILRFFFVLMIIYILFRLIPRTIQ